MLILKNQAGMVKEVKKGWSWTTFFFGTFVPLFRGDLKWAAIMIIVNLLVLFVTAGIGNIITIVVFAAVYNKVYIKDLYEKGYRAADPTQEQTLLNYVNS